MSGAEARWGAGRAPVLPRVASEPSHRAPAPVSRRSSPCTLAECLSATSPLMGFPVLGLWPPEGGRAGLGTCYSAGWRVLSCPRGTSSPEGDPGLPAPRGVPARSESIARGVRPRQHLSSDPRSRAPPAAPAASGGPSEGPRDLAACSRSTKAGCSRADPCGAWPGSYVGANRGSCPSLPPGGPVGVGLSIWRLRKCKAQLGVYMVSPRGRRRGRAAARPG